MGDAEATADFVGNDISKFVILHIVVRAVGTGTFDRREVPGEICNLCKFAVSSKEVSTFRRNPTLPFLTDFGSRFRI